MISAAYADELYGKTCQEVAPVKQVSPAFLQAAQSLLQYRK